VPQGRRPPVPGRRSPGWPSADGWGSKEGRMIAVHWAASPHHDLIQGSGHREVPISTWVAPDAHLQQSDPP